MFQGRASLSQICCPELLSVEYDRTLQEDADAFVNLTMQSLLATEHRLEDIRQHQQQDEACQLPVHYCQSG